MFSGDALKEPRLTTVMFLLLLKRLDKSSATYIQRTIVMDNVHDYALIM